MVGFRYSGSRQALAHIVIVSLVVASYVLRLWFLKVRQFDPDEFEHLHAAWLIAQGNLPYVDFFEHHTPWFHFFLAPFFSSTAKYCRLQRWRFGLIYLPVYSGWAA